MVLIGNLGRDPDVQRLEGNIAVAKFPLATTESYKDKEGKTISQTEWHTVVLWRGLAELAERYLHKGSLIYIEGRLRTRNWEDAQNVRRYATEIVADNMVMLDRKKEGENNIESSSSGSTLAQSQPASGTGNEENEDLPF